MNKTFEHVVRDESVLRSALREADVIPALMVLAHLSGDTALLERAAPHIQGGWNYQETLPEELKAEIRERLVQELKRQAQNPQEPVLPDQESLRRIMSASVGAEVPPEYVPLFVEELGLGGADARALSWRQAPSAASLDSFRVVIVGAGLGGICAGIRLKEAGIPFVILERNAAVGGTWHENAYPGCGVDTPSHFYSYSFNQNPDWTRYFAKRDEIWRYIDQTVDSFGLRAHIRFNTEVSAAHFDEEAAQWRVTCRSASGESETLSCKALVMAAGHNLPAMPSIEGLDSFKGPVLHTAQWDHQVNLQGLRVAMIGTGASGMQVGPALAPSLAKLTVFQRSPHWAMGNPNYHREVSQGQQWALRHIPYFREWSRFLIFWAASDAYHASLHIDPQWTQPEQSLNRENHQLRETIVAYMRKELDGDEELLRKCVPSYPPYGKRLLRDNHWFRMLKQPHVELVTEAVTRVCEQGVVDAEGRLHEVDALVLATGFHASRLLWPMDIRGRGGVSIRELWGDDDPRAFMGMTVPGFPNLFVLAGPNTILSHGGSAIFHAECQVHYITQALREMVEQRIETLEVRPEVHDRYNALVDDKHRNMVWAHPGVTSWYKNRQNRVTMSSPWRLVDYWRLTHDFRSADYVCTYRGPRPAAADADVSPSLATQV
jgi:4-hydroxyacetophenone monooxygenase